MSEEAWADLKDRLEKAAVTLDGMYQKALHPSDPGMSRLAGKAEGVRLALSYMSEYERSDVVACADNQPQEGQ